jgi:hypothetical protein
MRDIALDIHIDFCEVAIAEQGEVRSAGRIATKPEEIELFARRRPHEPDGTCRPTTCSRFLIRPINGSARKWTSFSVGSLSRPRVMTGRAARSGCP